MDEEEGRGGDAVIVTRREASVGERTHVGVS